MGLFVSRVPTDDNIADDPSREDYELLKVLGATQIDPRMHPRFLEYRSWESISIRSSCPVAAEVVEDDVCIEL